MNTLYFTFYILLKYRFHLLQAVFPTTPSSPLFVFSIVYGHITLDTPDHIYYLPSSEKMGYSSHLSVLNFYYSSDCVVCFNKELNFINTRNLAFGHFHLSFSIWHKRGTYLISHLMVAELINAEEKQSTGKVTMSSSASKVHAA